jgi:hypothetical protein
MRELPFRNPGIHRLKGVPCEACKTRNQRGTEVTQYISELQIFLGHFLTKSLSGASIQRLKYQYLPFRSIQFWQAPSPSATDTTLSLKESEGWVYRMNAIHKILFFKYLFPTHLLYDSLTEMRNLTIRIPIFAVLLIQQVVYSIAVTQADQSIQSDIKNLTNPGHIVPGKKLKIQPDMVSITGFFQDEKCKILCLKRNLNFIAPKGTVNQKHRLHKMRNGREIFYATLEKAL